MFTLHLPPALERQLVREAKRRGRTKTALAQQAVVELLEDADDIREADVVIERIARGTERIHSSVAVKRALRLSLTDLRK